MMWACYYAEPLFAAYHLGDFNADLQLLNGGLNKGTEEYTHDISSDARHYRLSPHTLLIPGAGDRLVTLKADATSPAKRKIVYANYDIQRKIKHIQRGYRLVVNRVLRIQHKRANSGRALVSITSISITFWRLQGIWRRVGDFERVLPPGLRC
jgi:hypothetical protein